MPHKLSDTWQSLIAHQARLSQSRITNLFEQDKTRVENFSIDAASLHLDYSKNLLDQAALADLLKLAEQAKLAEKREAMFRGESTNSTENRPVLHTALRNPDLKSLFIDDHNIVLNIQQALAKMEQLADQIHQKRLLGATGKPIDTLVNLGIGGSDLGPALVYDALKSYQTNDINIFFVSNVDPYSIEMTLKQIDPERTLFIIASKSFTTQETLTNAKAALNWLSTQLDNAQSSDKHFIAITAKPELAEQFGIDSQNIYPIWDWVGGRYSLWSAVGLPIAIALGMDNFKALLAGARAMDKHFQATPLEKNMPVILALIGIWHINFCNAQTQAIIPYAEALRYLVPYLQQLDMESNGKSVNLEGETIDYNTAPIIWGAIGSNSQHACHQLLHQGTPPTPVDFILPIESLASQGTTQHKILTAHCLAQTKALMEGAPNKNPHMAIAGNKPSNLILLPKITPFSLGALIALYEHKAFVQGVIWNINSFDQWGVELGKTLANSILACLDNPHGIKNTALDASTLALINECD